MDRNSGDEDNLNNQPQPINPYTSGRVIEPISPIETIQPEPVQPILQQPVQPVESVQNLNAFETKLPSNLYPTPNKSSYNQLNNIESTKNNSKPKKIIAKIIAFIVVLSIILGSFAAYVAIYGDSVAKKYNKEANVYLNSLLSNCSVKQSEKGLYKNDLDKVIKPKLPYVIFGEYRPIYNFSKRLSTDIDSAVTKYDNLCTKFNYTVLLGYKMNVVTDSIYSQIKYPKMDQTIIDESIKNLRTLRQEMTRIKTPGLLSEVYDSDLSLIDILLTNYSRASYYISIKNSNEFNKLMADSLIAYQNNAKIQTSALSVSTDLLAQKDAINDIIYRTRTEFK